MSVGKRYANGIAERLIALGDDERSALLCEDGSWSWRDLLAAAAVRASIARQLRRDGPFHIGLLLENVPEYLFWLSAAALGGATVVGINPTRRGAELERDIRHADCQLIVTDAEGALMLDALDLPVDGDRVLVIGSGGYEAHLEANRGAPVPDPPDPSTLLLLLFTSGSTSAPKLVKCSTGRLAELGEKASGRYGFVRDDVCYCAMPLFHGNATMGVWAPAVHVGATMALRRRFSASGFLPDVQRYGATFFNYVGKSLSYILATPESPSDADNHLRLGYGTEASWKDIATFERRFGCPLAEGFGMSEGGGVQIRRTPESPADSIGRPSEATIRIVDPDTLRECPPARVTADGRLANPDEAIGEIVNTAGLDRFEGYYRNPEAERERSRNGWFWTGDLAYRDADGWFYFAGRSSDRLRVDSENFGAAPIERILYRHPRVIGAAVYPVPDPDGGDAVMAALELDPGEAFDPSDFERFLDAQADLGSKWAPRFVRIVDELPLTGTNKVRKVALRDERWDTTDRLWWRPDPRSGAWSPMSRQDRADHERRFAERGRLAALRPGR